MPRLLGRKSRITLMLTGYGIEDVVLLLVEDPLQADDAAHDFVGRRLVHAALDVGARVDARRRGPTAGSGSRRTLPGFSGYGSRNQQPRVVERRVLGVELLPLGLDVGERNRPGARTPSSTAKR